MKLSPHFTLAEFVASDKAAELGIDNTLPDVLLPNAIKTAEMLERIRACLCQLAGREIRISLTSGYRCPSLNKAVGSGSTSDHLLAWSADWRAPDFGSPFEIATALAPQVTVLGIGQLIHEFPGPRAWVHTSAKLVSKPVNRIITIRPGGVVQPGVQR